MQTEERPEPLTRSLSHSSGLAGVPLSTGGSTRSINAPSRASLLRTGSLTLRGTVPPVPHVTTPPVQQPPAELLGPSLQLAVEEESWDDEGQQEAAAGSPSHHHGVPVVSFDSVVKVFATIQEPDFGNPWQPRGIENAKGSGVAIETESGPRILTAAHCVADRTFIQVQRIGVERPHRYVASVHAVCHECDLALLSVGEGGSGDHEHEEEDNDAKLAEEFWADLRLARLGSIPSLRSLVLVAGFPVGGEELSITEGVVSRIEGQPYSHSNRQLLAVTVDAAINQGNSGGPAFHGRTGDLIGIAFQALQGAENTGHVVPPPVIQHFLEGVEKFPPEQYRGFPHAGIQTQQLTNPYLRRHCELEDSGGVVHGVLVTNVSYGNTCDGVLQRGDVLTRVSGRDVADNGTVAYNRHCRVKLEIAFTMFQCGESIDLNIVRGGKAMTVQATARPPRRLVPLTQHDRQPPYFIYCGLVFQPLSLDYIDAQQAGGGLDPHFLHLLYSGRRSSDRLQVVVLSQTLSDRVNIGYDVLRDEVIKTVNGETVCDLRDFVDKVEHTVGSTVRIETSGDDVIILPSPKQSDAVAANERILARYKVVRDKWLD